MSKLPFCLFKMNIQRFVPVHENWLEILLTKKQNNRFPFFSKCVVRGHYYKNRSVCTTWSKGILLWSMLKDREKATISSVHLNVGCECKENSAL